MALVAAVPRHDTDRGMAVSVRRIALRHEAVVTLILLAALLVNLLAVGYVTPPADALDRDLPMAAQCQGGGPGCVEQPMIPPPVIGLPRFQPSAPVVFGSLVAVEPAPFASPHESPPDDIVHPPVLDVA